MIPAILYGHGKENVSLSIPVDAINAVIRHGSQFVEIGGEITDSALIGEVKWDALGIDILHVDLTRALAGEKAEVTVSIEIRGQAPGTKQGGIVQLLLHELEIMCPVTSIPEKIMISVNALELDGSIIANQLELPAGATLLIPEDTVIVQCVEAMEAPEGEEIAGVGGAAEPEVIGAKDEDDEEGDE